MKPTRAGYLSFIRFIMAIPVNVLADNSPVIDWTFNGAMDWVNPQLACVPQLGDPAYPSLYAKAVYNFGGDRIINVAQDPEGAPNVAGSDPPMPYFAFARKRFDINGFVSGIVTSTNDEGTGVSLVVPKFAETLTISDLQTLKTPWGREYMAIAQQYGPTIWGIS